MLPLTRQVWRDARARTLAFACLFGIYAYVQPAAYRSSYSSLRARETFAISFGPNTAVRLFYGEPRDLLTAAGYASWRVAGTLAIFAAIFGLLAAVRGLRAEEDSGRAEAVLALPLSRGSMLRAALSAAAFGLLLMWCGEFAGSALARLPLGGSAYMALATVSVAAAFVAIGTVVCQLAPTRRTALELGGGLIVIMFALRVVADTARGTGWLRWLSPLGWAENMRPFTDPQPWVLVLPVLVTAALLLGAWRLSLRRDVGTGLLRSRDSSVPRLGLLSSPLLQSLRGQSASLLIWTGALAAWSLVDGGLASATGNGAISPQLRRELAKLGTGSIATPSGYLGLTMLFTLLAVCLFACAQLGSVRQEEAELRLETLFGLPLGRLRWLGGRVTIAIAAIGLLSLTSAVAAYLGALGAGAYIPFSKMLEAGLNFLPVTLLFLGLAALAYAAIPRAATGISYGALTIAFLWQLVGSLLSVPSWLRDATPFAHVAPVPAGSIRVGAALIMLAAAAALLAAAGALFRRRDLTGT